MSTDEAVMETYSSSLYTGLQPHLAKHSPTAANMAVETPSAAEGQLSSLESRIEEGEKRERDS